MGIDQNQEVLPNGTLLNYGKYRIDGYISSGGFGNTYQATDLAFDKKVAIKELFIKESCFREGDSMTGSMNPQKFKVFQERFKREARRMFNLSNKHIVKVHNLFDENGTSYYVMDFIEGDSLSKKLKTSKRPMQEIDVMLILPQILDALETVHSESIYHLDLKPANIMMDVGGNIQLIDFGASKQGDPKYGVLSVSSTLTYTPGYAPGEQVDLLFDKFGPWTDIYALGATLFNLLTLKNPPLQSDIQEDAKDAFSPLEGVSKKMYDLIVWMMKPVRTMRPQSIAAIKMFLAEDTSAHVRNEVTSQNGEDTIRKKTTPAPKEKPKQQAVQQPVQQERRQKNEVRKPDNVSSEDTVRRKPAPETRPQPQLVSAKKDELKELQPENGQRKKMLIGGVGIVAVAAIIYGAMYGGFNSSSSYEEAVAEEVVDTVSIALSVKDVTDMLIKITEGPSNLREYTYTGSIDISTNLPTGHGVAKFKAVGGNPAGIYMGNFVRGLLHDSSGEASLSFENGDSFNGTFEKGYYGKGKYTLSNHEYFKGTFKNGAPYSGEWYSADHKPLSKVVNGKDESL